MFHKKPQVYVRPQRGRTSATSRGGVLFDPYRVGDASSPFFLERGIPSEFVLIVSLIIIHAFTCTPDEVCCFFDHFSGTWNSFGIFIDHLTDHCSYILRNLVGVYFFFIIFRNMVSLRDIDWVDTS